MNFPRKFEYPGIVVVSAKIRVAPKEIFNKILTYAAMGNPSIIYQCLKRDAQRR